MKKLLSALSATALVTTSTLTVVACSSNAKYKEFMNWINNKESFLLYLGADDCTYCQQFEIAKEQNKSEFDNHMYSLTNEYNKSMVRNNEVKDEKTGFGDNLKNNFDFRLFKTENLEDNFKEKWSENILDWIIDEAANIHYEKNYKNLPGISNQETLKKRARKESKTYFDSVKATPMFILIRNGKLVSWQVGFEEDEAGWNSNSLNELFEPLIQDVKDPFVDITIAQKINDGPPSEPEPDPDPTDPSPDPGGEETYKFNQNLLNQYHSFYNIN